MRKVTDLEEQQMKFLWTTLSVKDLDTSIAFYSSLLGLKVLKRHGAGPDVEIAFMGNGAEGETLVELLADRSKSSLDHGESVSIGFAVDSVEAMLDVVGDRGIPIHRGPIETPNGRFFFVKDPDGLIVQFFQKKQ